MTHRQVLSEWWGPIHGECTQSRGDMKKPKVVLLWIKNNEHCGHIEHSWEKSRASQCSFILTSIAPALGYEA